MGPLTKQLLMELDTLLRLLSAVGETRWSAYFKKAELAVRRRDFRGIELIMGSYGGMARFNDFVLHPLNGHDLPESELRACNDQLDHSRSEIYRLCIDIKKDYETDLTLRPYK